MHLTRLQRQIGLVLCVTGILVTLMFLVYRINTQLRVEAEEKRERIIKERDQLIENEEMDRAIEEEITRTKEEAENAKDEQKQAQETESSWMTWMFVGLIVVVLGALAYYLTSSSMFGEPFELGYDPADVDYKIIKPHGYDPNKVDFLQQSFPQAGFTQSDVDVLKRFKSVRHFDKEASVSEEGSILDNIQRKINSAGAANFFVQNPHFFQKSQ